MTITDKGRRIVVAVVVVVALQVLAAVVYLELDGARRAVGDVPFRYERVGVSPRFPDVVLVRADGTALSPSELSGRPVLLHFWATTCPPCRDELPELLRLGAERAELRVVALSVDDDWASVRRFFGGSVPVEVFRDPSGGLARAYEVDALPDTVLLDPRGTAKLRFRGARRWLSQEAGDVLARNW